MVVITISSRRMTGKGRIEFGGVTDDFCDISLTNITTIKNKKERKKEETKEIRNLQNSIKDPHVTCRI
jgi:hypothetical protein